MILLLLTLILFIILLIPIIYFRKKGGDLFSPIIVSFSLLIITNIPYLLSMSFDYTVIDPLVRKRISEIELEYAVAYYILIVMVGVIGLLLGMQSRTSNLLVKKIPVILNNENSSRYHLAIVVGLFLGVLSYVQFIQSVGGINFWIQNLYQRASMTSGSGYTLIFLILLKIGVYIYICSFKQKKSIFKYVFLFLLVIATSLILSSMGGRKPTLQFIFFCFIVWHFGVAKFKKIKLRVLFIIPVAIIYILIMPIIRSPLGIEYYMNNPEILKSEIVEDIGSVTKSVSYIDTYLLVLDEFSIDNLWLGRSFIDLLYAPLPSKIYPDKPPVDDGVYLRTIAEGWEVTPSAPYREMYQSSWPPETLGNMYMNFWIPGVFVGMFILGMIYIATYQYMKKSQYTIFSILLYGSFILNFHLSNLRIVQTISDIIVITLFLSLFFFSFNKKLKR